MTSSISSLYNTTAYQPVPVVATASTSAQASGTAATAVALSSASAVVSSIGGGSGLGVYTPQGLLNSIQQAGTLQQSTIATPTSGSDVTNEAQQSADQAIVGSLPSSPETSGIYTGNGVLQSDSSSATSANWADILKTNPSLAGTVISDSYQQGVIASLTA